MNPLYNRKLQSALIATGKKVELMEHAPTVRDIMQLFDKFIDTAEGEDMKGQAKASAELIAGLVKWQIEKL
jgi:hypothetical protein